MTPPCILAIDQGTTNTKVILIDETGANVARASQPLTQSYPRPAWVEQDALAIWNSVRDAIDECLAHAGEVELVAVAVSNQREATILWERATGQPLGPVIGWQCHRTAPYCEELRTRGLEPFLRERTGLTIDPMFSATKARWLLDSIPDGQRRAERGELCLGTMDSWLLWNLTGGALHACDCTNASRTQLYNLRTLAWDPDLLALFGLSVAALPEVRPSSSLFGTTVACGRLQAGIPIASLVGDSHAALFGHGRFQSGAVKATYGTGSSLMAPTPSVALSSRGISSTIAWGIGDLGHVTYALEGNIYATGAAVQWLGEILGLPNPGPDIEQLARRAPDAGGVYFVPAFAGLGAPHWQSMARALFCGITLGTTSAHLARAALEAIAYQVRDVLDAMSADLGGELQMLLADGGASRNDLLMQFQADILGRSVERSSSADLSALGAAYLAGLAVGLWPSLEAIERLVPAGDLFDAHLAMERRCELYAGWKDAVARTIKEPA